tara:strand:+ start:246 stop:836 length:591 start_codon:yes stop_codon:yes gene_type:complete
MNLNKKIASKFLFLFIIANISGCSNISNELENQINKENVVTVTIEKSGSREAYEIKALIAPDSSESVSWLGFTNSQIKELIQKTVTSSSYDIAKNPKTFIATSIFISQKLKHTDNFSEALQSHNEMLQTIKLQMKLKESSDELIGWCKISVQAEASNSYGVPGYASGTFAFNHSAYLKNINSGKHTLLSMYMFRIY